MSSYKHIEVAPITGNIGAEILGVDLKVNDAETIQEIRRALLEHVVVFFRDQDLDMAEYISFAQQFGPFGKEPFVETMSEHPNVIAVVKEATETKTINFGGQWHSDWSFQECPPFATLLRGIDIPPYGGDTLFANMYLGYETLSDGIKKLIEPLIAVHSARRPYGLGKSILGDTDKKAMKIVRSEEAHNEVEHPLVRVHPETGRKLLFINPVYTVRLKGMSESESKDLLNQLYRHALNEAFTCRFRWRKNSIAMWDNRCSMHLAINDYDGYRRELHRITIAGDEPYGTAKPKPDISRKVLSAG
ncbi:TauD/TfdA dioxygenase family protein [Sneathiella glossodoripedis]|uniref:TauD/TfdA dioxygenase family protein n=1 Tax=Sneathiella glossodoripedis TaxID=418853 RepID=UPI00046F485B|nr:TauD/TfdA family dioxygenase [Sneathiella glossodoripedis]